MQTVKEFGKIIEYEIIGISYFGNPTELALWFYVEDFASYPFGVVCIY
jgi:hypothetical protein